MFQPVGSPPIAVEVVVTAADRDRLSSLTRSVLEDGLAASAQTVAPVDVLSRRDGEIHQEVMARVAFHTRAALVTAIAERAQRGSGDDVARVIALRVLDASSAYLQWIVRETAGADARAGARR